LHKQPFQKQLGNLLKDYRKQNHLTQYQVATQSNLSLPTIRQLEQGKGNLKSFYQALKSLTIEVRGYNLPQGKHLGERISHLRCSRKVSQRTLCCLIACSQPSLINLEKNNKGRVETLNKALLALGSGAYLANSKQKQAFYTHTGNSALSQNWQTPQALLEQLYQVFSFDLDPCSPTRDKRKAPVKAKMYYTETDNGLSLPWHGLCQPALWPFFTLMDSQSQPGSSPTSQHYHHHADSSQTRYLLLA
jgi:transcriptional regulator with XRE-family HTH domain